MYISASGTPNTSSQVFVALSFFSVLRLLCLCARLFICALWSPAGKGLTSWLSIVVSNCEYVTFPLVSCFRCGIWLYRFLIFAPLLTSINKTFQRKNVNIFWPIIFSICFGCSKEPSHWDGSFECPQHIFWLKNKLFFCYALFTKVLDSFSVKVFGNDSLIDLSRKLICKPNNHTILVLTCPVVEEFFLSIQQCMKQSTLRACNTI